MRAVVVFVLGGAVVIALVGGGAYLLTLEPEEDEPRVATTGWDRYDARGRVLRVHYLGSSCQEKAVAEVEERPRRVVVTVRATVAPGRCARAAVPRTVSVRLEAPLGDRSVHDGACLQDGSARGCERPRRRTAA
ncbi:hypothetical protein [Nocardioides sp. TF02-7]|uniref:hypothetical protein n=1 Tax=Nocardioides sp. TF02-7 TaxID=2917724 RepID=UPI001F066B74|nr:hypothetical protein [Nocardioides sp. TF02-7]UMG92791.1 hypothetical protein MF408_24385 [Nocardioides sp. TF02-7]